MAEDTNKFIKYIDQLIPFLEASPTWFKIWIYMLIFLIFITIAGMVVIYLTSKEEWRAKVSLKYFSIERPKNNEEIPLGESQSWIIHGHFPIVEDHDLSTTAKVKIEVFKLPNRQEIAQTGISRISTVQGVWTFEFVKFISEGTYEIIATGFMGSQNVWHRITVQCTKKAEAFKHSIERDREIRGVAKLVLPSPEELALPLLKQRLHRLQTEFFERFKHYDLNGALEIVLNTFDAVDSALMLFPDDLHIQGVRAYSFKNYALIMKRLQRNEEFARALNESAKMFEAILEQNPRDASAWNGIGNIALLCGELKRALFYIDRALEIYPNYEEALHDRDIVNNMLTKKGMQ